MTRRTFASLVLAIGLFGCDSGEAESQVGSDVDADEQDRVRVALVELGELAAWTVLDASEDPLADHRPDLVDCPVGAWATEFGQLEVQTGVCNYLALATPTLLALAPGDRVIVDLWHDTLDAPTPASGHVAVLLGGALVGEAEVVIPSAAAVFRFELEIDEPVPAGTPVVLHLHNHGFNAWTFVNLDAETS
ncbi:hypothetical protein ACNOYE_34325 [Nannocystaceae bacterium ST9]